MDRQLYCSNHYNHNHTHNGYVRRISGYDRAIDTPENLFGRILSWIFISRMENGDSTAGEPLVAHASRYIHSLLRRSPSSTCLARGTARCLRLASVFASRVRVLTVAFGLAGVCARVGRLGRWRHPSRTRYLHARACPRPVARNDH